jgi:hypothetical protein
VANWVLRHGLAASLAVLAAWLYSRLVRTLATGWDDLPNGARVPARLVLAAILVAPPLLALTFAAIFRRMRRSTPFILGVATGSLAVTAAVGMLVHEALWQRLYGS